LPVGVNEHRSELNLFSEVKTKSEDRQLTNAA